MAGGEYNRVLGVLRRAALFAAVAALLWLARPRPLDLAIGSVLLVPGEALRLWAAGHLIKTERLITSGPYRYTRNPLYLGRLLILTGLCVMARLPHGANWYVLAGSYAVFFGYYLPRKERVEPARLREAHGAAYERYRETVPALFPAFRPYAAGSRSPWKMGSRMRDDPLYRAAQTCGLWTCENVTRMR